MDLGLEKTRFFYFLVFLILLFTALALFVATSWGIGLSPDSVSYIEFAQFINQAQFTQINPHYPPLYPILISISSFFFDSIFTATRTLHILLHVLIVFALFIFLYQFCQKRLVVLLGIVLFSVSPTLLLNNSMAWSESSFMLFTIVGFYFLLQYLLKDQWTLLIYSAIFIAAAVLTRYVGVTLIMTGSLMLLVLVQGWQKKLTTSIIFSSIALFPLVVYSIFNLLLHETASNRTLTYHLIDYEKLMEGINAVLSMYLADYLIGGILLAIFLIGLFYFEYKAHNYTARVETRLVSYLLVIFSVVYILFLLFSISFIDAYTPLDYRILYPIYISILLLLLVRIDFLLSCQISHKQDIIKNNVFYGVILIFLIAKMLFFSSTLSALTANGQGYLSKAWRSSQILNQLSHFKGAHIYSNGFDIINVYYLEQKSKLIPRFIEPTSNQLNPNYHTEVEAMQASLAADGGLIIYLDGFMGRWYLPDVQKLYSDLNLTGQIYQMRDGLIIVIPPAHYQAQ